MRFAADRSRAVIRAAAARVALRGRSAAALHEGAGRTKLLLTVDPSSVELKKWHRQTQTQTALSYGNSTALESNLFEFACSSQVTPPAGSPPAFLGGCDNKPNSWQGRAHAASATSPALLALPFFSLSLCRPPSLRLSIYTCPHRPQLYLSPGVYPRESRTRFQERARAHRRLVHTHGEWHTTTAPWSTDHRATQ